MKGGYIMVDCQKINLLGGDKKQEVSGIYEIALAAINSGAPIIAYNCEYGEGVPMTPINVFSIIEAGVIIFTASILQIRINSDDEVWIVPLIPAQDED